MSIPKIMKVETFLSLPVEICPCVVDIKTCQTDTGETFEIGIAKPFKTKDVFFLYKQGDILGQKTCRAMVLELL